jgi:hypothetical protein
MGIKFILAIIAALLGIVMMEGKGGYKRLFWLGICSTFVRQIKLPLLGPTDPAALIFLLLTCVNPRVLLRVKFKQWAFFLFALVSSGLVALFNEIPLETSFNWQKPFLVFFLVAVNVSYYVRTRQDELKLMKAFLLMGFIFSFTAVMAYLGFYDGVILFGGAHASDLVGSDRTVYSSIYGISYSNLVMCISAISIVFLPWMNWRPILKALFVGVIVLGVLITLKRVAVLALLLALPFTLWIEFRNNNKKTVFIILASLGILCTGTITSIIWGRFGQAIDTINDVGMIDSSSAKRLDRLGFAWEFFTASPVWGAGAGRLTYIHNAFLEVLGNCGVIGLGLFTSFFSCIRLGMKRILINPWAVAVIIFILTLALFEAGINRVELIYFWAMAYGGYLVRKKSHFENHFIGLPPNKK